ncbi:MAG: DUF4230 domain-containing protein [Oscillospiraceae bacterium]|nr:DUF4230 domain-containing protein [Oscillospiraceae bacterium]
MVMTKRAKLYLVLLSVIVVAIIALVIWHAASRGGGAEPVSISPKGNVVEQSRSVKLVKVEKEITTEMISETLRDVGLLVTQEYAFTEVVSYSSVKSLFNIDLPFTESSYVAGYDGVVTAGIDFAGIVVEKDDELHSVTVRLPRPKLLNVDIDPKSFRLYSEKESIWNPVSISDYNDSLIELEENARTKAIEGGIFERAGSNARLLILSMVGSLLDPSEYTVQCFYL